MTIEMWQACFRRYVNEGTTTERTMARLLWEISLIDLPSIVSVFDRYASEILEAAS